MTYESLCSFQNPPSGKSTLTVEPTREARTNRAKTLGDTETFMGLAGYSVSDVLETRSPAIINPTKNLKIAYILCQTVMAGVGIHA